MSALPDKAVLHQNVEINCNDIFMRHIFWSTWNDKAIVQAPLITRSTKNGGLLGADVGHYIDCN